VELFIGSFFEILPKPTFCLFHCLHHKDKLVKNGMAIGALVLCSIQTDSVGARTTIGEWIFSGCVRLRQCGYYGLYTLVALRFAVTSPDGRTGITGTEWEFEHALPP